MRCKGNNLEYELQKNYGGREKGDKKRSRGFKYSIWSAFKAELFNEFEENLAVDHTRCPIQKHILHFYILKL